MSGTTKPTSPLGADNVMREIYNPEDDSITTSAFITAQVGYKITRTDTGAGDLGGNAAGDDFTYFDGATQLYTLRVLWSDVTKETLVSVERVS